MSDKIKGYQLFLLFVICPGCLFSQDSIPLYKTVPNSLVSHWNEQHQVTNGVLRISQVISPTLTVFRPAGKDTLRSAVIICPGGGYRILAASHEGMDVARLLNQWGIVAIVLKYRLPSDSIMKDKSLGPLQDVQEAIKIVRSRSKEWNIDPAKIGVMGFSAGGHLAASAANRFREKIIENPDNISLRPDFSILIYPVISFTDSLTHMGSRNNLLGKNPTPQQVILHSNESQVTPQTPPAFMVHAGDDKAVPVGNSLVYYQSLLKNQVPAELHIYPTGGHGFGLVNKTVNDPWPDRLKNWLINNHL